MSDRAQAFIQRTINWIGITLILFIFFEPYIEHWLRHQP